MELDQGRRLRSRERTTATQVAIVPYKRFIMTLPFCPRGHLTHAKLRVSISLTRRPASDGASPLPSPHLFCEAATFVVARTRVEIVPARLLARVVYPHCRRRHHKLEPCSLAPHRQIDDDGAAAARYVCRRWRTPSSFSPSNDPRPPLLVLSLHGDYIQAAAASLSNDQLLQPLLMVVQLA